MDAWRIVELLVGGLAAVLWWMAKDGQAEAKARISALEAELARMRAEHARSEERDKAFEAGIARLTKAIDDFDSRIGRKIEQLAAVVNSATRRFTPHSGMPTVRDEGE